MTLLQKPPLLPTPLLAVSAPVAAASSGLWHGEGGAVAKSVTSKTVLGHLRGDTIKLNAASFDLLFGVADGDAC
jgi:hypothetical protein